MEPYLDNPPTVPSAKPDGFWEQFRAEQDERWRREAPARRAVLLCGPPLADVEAAVECKCSCHPRPGQSELHAAGAECGCQLTPEQRTVRSAEASEALRRLLNERVADEPAEDSYRARVLAAAADEGAVVTTFMSAAPFVVAGTVDGYSFYLRERHDMWRLVVAGADDPGADVWNTRPPGALVIDEGTTDSWDFDSVEHVRRAVRTVRDFVARRTCPHAGARAWCPDCGTRM